MSLPAIDHLALLARLDAEAPAPPAGGPKPTGVAHGAANGQGGHHAANGHAGHAGHHAPAVDRYCQQVMTNELATLAAAPPGARNDALNKAAFALGQFVGARLMDAGHVERELTAVARSIGLGDAEIAKTVRSGVDGGAKEPRDVAHVGVNGHVARPADVVGPAGHEAAPGANGQGRDDDRATHEFSDLGNGRRLVDLHGHRIRHCKSYGDWMIYDGRRWTRDDLYEIEAMAQDIPKRVLLDMPATPDPEAIKACIKWSVASQSRERLDAMSRTARSMLAVTPNQLDQDPWLFNVENGTIDLRTGGFREHRSGDLITKIANVAYDPAATAPRWERFVLEIMGDNQDLADYLRRAVGYAITGVIRQHVLFFMYGTGSNGKTTWLNLLFNTLGDYANSIDSDLLVSQNYAQHPTGLTELEGRRFVACDESDENRRMAEAQVKKLTGGNPIQARRMQKDFYTFRPTHHLFYAANHKPEIRGMDVGIWRRIKLIPFVVSYDPSVKGSRKPDLELEGRLAAERPGILNWMLRGCREWQERGLDEPLTILQAGRDYQSEMDVLGWFLDEKCVADETARVVFPVLYGEYKSWCEVNNVAPLSNRKFSNQLGDRTFKTFKSNSTVFKLGLRLKTPEERYAEMQAAHEAAGGETGANRGGVDLWANGRDDDWTKRP